MAPSDHIVTKLGNSMVGEVAKAVHSYLLNGIRVPSPRNLLDFLTGVYPLICYAHNWP